MISEDHDEIPKPDLEEEKVPLEKTNDHTVAISHESLEALMEKIYNEAENRRYTFNYLCGAGVFTEVSAEETCFKWKSNQKPDDDLKHKKSFDLFFQNLYGIALTEAQTFDPPIPELQLYQEMLERLQKPSVKPIDKDAYRLSSGNAASLRPRCISKDGDTLTFAYSSSYKANAELISSV